MSGEPIHVAVSEGLLTARLSRGHGNAINPDVIERLLSVCDQAEADPRIRGVLLASSGKLFCPGLDLQELSRLDRAALGHFIHRFNTCVLRMYTLSKPLVAALHGHAVAGGCVLALTADWRVLRRGAMIGLNEIRVGVPLPLGVAAILAESVNPSKREEVALFGRNYRDDEALVTGLAHELADEKGFEKHCRKRLGELADKDPQAFSVTKRYLREAATDRIRAAGDGHEEEFLNSWFSGPTQERILGLVRDLAARG